MKEEENASSYTYPKAEDEFGARMREWYEYNYGN
jgi:hypothetical protein